MTRPHPTSDSDTETLCVYISVFQCSFMFATYLSNLPNLVIMIKLEQVSSLKITCFSITC